VTTVPGWEDRNSIQSWGVQLPHATLDFLLRVLFAPGPALPALPGDGYLVQSTPRPSHPPSDSPGREDPRRLPGVFEAFPCVAIPPTTPPNT
jgi:hypothetical protein